ncbi:hypothetical protein AB2T64_20060 [Clostridium butyricum]
MIYVNIVRMSGAVINKENLNCKTAQGMLVQEQYIREEFQMDIITFAISCMAFVVAIISVINQH